MPPQRLAGEYAKNAPGYDDESETEVLIRKLAELFTDADECAPRRGPPDVTAPPPDDTDTEARQKSHTRAR